MVTNQTSHPAKAAPAGVGLRSGGAVDPAFCRRMALHRLGIVGSVRCSAGRPGSGPRFAQGGKGAVGRALCLRHRAMRPNPALGLLRGAWVGRVADGTETMRDLAGSGDTFVGGAGASAMGVLIRSTRVGGRASPTQWGTPTPEPCDNELPSHAPNSLVCPALCFRLHARSAGRGDKKLRQQRH